MKKSNCYNDQKRISNKKWIFAAVFVVACAIFGGFFSTLTASAREFNKFKVVQQQDDKHQIPDKYSTGPKGSLKKASPDGTYGGLTFKMSYTEDKVTKERSYNGNIRGTVVNELKSPVIIEGYDFSDMMIKTLEQYKITKDFVIKFKNCKFNVVYTDYEERKLKFVFENCSIKQYKGSNAEFYNCAFGGSTDDGMHIFRNVTVKDCYFSNMSMMAPSSTHVDGVQIFGDDRSRNDKTLTRGNNNPNAERELVDVYNIHFSNCRFEIPDLRLSGNPASVNACFSLALQYSNGSDVSLKDCIVNGGSNTLYAFAGTTDLSIKNIVYDNIRIGGASSGAFYPKYNDNLTLTGLKGIDSLYVGSVWKDDTGIHLSVTNDTTKNRVLKIVTDKGIFTKTIGAGPDGVNATATSFAQLPIDIEVTVPKDCAYVVCLDATEQEHIKQIRFVNYSGQDVYISPKLLGGYKNINDNVLMTGYCGNGVRFTLTKDYVLTISGSGDMEAYYLNTKDMSKYYEPAWYPYQGMIKEVIVQNGVTRIGGFAFKNCFSLEKVTLPDSLASIEGNAFANCCSLTSVDLPVSLANANIKGTAFIGTRLDPNAYIK